LRATPNDPSEALGSGNYAISALLLRCMSPEVAFSGSAAKADLSPEGASKRTSVDYFEFMGSRTVPELCASAAHFRSSPCRLNRSTQHRR